MLFNNELSETLQVIMQWGFVVILIVIILIVLSKTVLKKMFPSLVSLFYFLIPTYLVNVILVTALGSDTINEYTVFIFPDIALYLCPPLVWDALFGMGLEEGRIELMGISGFFIIFLPIWVAVKTSAGIRENADDDDKKDKWMIRIRRLISAWILIAIMGLGMTTFHGYILNILTSMSVLGINLLIILIIVVFVILAALLIPKYLKKRKREKDPNCKMINGKWVCRYDEE